MDAVQRGVLNAVLTGCGAYFSAPAAESRCVPRPSTTANRGDRLAELAEDEIILRWVPAFPSYKHEPAGWRFPCPCCGSGRELSVRAKPGHRRPQWDPKCRCPREEVAAKLAALGLISGRRPPKLDRDEVIALALADMPPQSLRLALLELAGLGTREALDKMGVHRAHRARVIAGRRKGVTNLGT